MDARIDWAIKELAALGGVHPSRLADDTIELRPAPAAPELSMKVNEIFTRAGLRELRPWIWGVAEAGMSELVPQGTPNSDGQHGPGMVQYALTLVFVSVVVTVLLRRLGHQVAKHSRTRALGSWLSRTSRRSPAAARDGQARSGTRSSGEALASN
jgi:hypothetical protein